MPYKANESRRHKIPKARYRVENWSNYDAALRRRGDLTPWMTPEAVAAWTPPATGRHGRPSRCSDLAIEAGLMPRLAFGRPWRQTEGLLGSLMRLLGLDLPVPDHTTFSRRSADLKVASALADGAYDGEPVYCAVAAHSPAAEVIIPPRSSAVPSDTAESAPTQRDRHIQLINECGRLGWQRAVHYGRRSLGEVAMMRYKQLIGRSLRARTLPAQKVEATVGRKVMNIMTSLGMPTTRKVG